MGAVKILQRHRSQVNPQFSHQCEPLEARVFLSTVSINAYQAVRAVNNQLLGVNLTHWDTNQNSSATQSLVQQAGLTAFRFPGGSNSDKIHFDAAPYPGDATPGISASLIEEEHGTGMVTLDYGSGSPQEAAAFLAYLNGSPTNQTSIGIGKQWFNDASTSWVNKDWKTVGYWASLRAAAPLATDDGLNYLRLNHAGSYGIHYWEVGNEEYGSWETDHHGQSGDAGVAHDPSTYVNFAIAFKNLANSIDPSISIGFDSGSPLAQDAGGQWIGSALSLGYSRGFTPGFISDHNYMQAPGSENDQELLLNTESNSSATDPLGTGHRGWIVRGTEYQALLEQKLGTAASNVEILATEFNSVYTLPGKQTTSLVNGLFLADSLGNLLNSAYNGAWSWDLRNGYETDGNSSPNLYGWRTNGDYGMIGSYGGSAPASGINVPYPTYFAEQLVSKMVHNGDTVVSVSNSNALLGVYAVKQANGHLDLLVINKSAGGVSNNTFNISGFAPQNVVQQTFYGEAEDNAQAATTDGHSSLGSAAVSLTGLTITDTGSSFSFAFNPYSMNVIDLTPVNRAPIVFTAASASPSTVTGTTTHLSVLGADDDGEGNLKYTWSATGPANVSFTANGTNAAKNSTAIFSKIGTYNFMVTIADAAGLSTTSAVAVNVTATTRIAISPSSVAISPAHSLVFGGAAVDQFGDPISGGIRWAIASGVGKIDPFSGVYTAPATTGSAVVVAIAGNGSASSNVLVTNANTLPSGFTDSDIGAPAQAGSASADSNGIIAVTGGGAGFTAGASDQFNFASALLAGSQTFSAEIGSLNSTVTTAAAGLMFRVSTAANSIFASVIATRSSVAFVSRASAGGAVTSASVLLNNLGSSKSVWVKLVNTANSVTAFYSNNGSTWSQIGLAARTITLGSQYRAGFAVSSFNNTSLATAVFNPPTSGNPFPFTAAKTSSAAFSTQSLSTDSDKKKLLDDM